LEGFETENYCMPILYCDLEYFIAIWYNFWLFGTFLVIWYIFGYLVHFWLFGTFLDLIIFVVTRYPLLEWCTKKNLATLGPDTALP
jgi:hypothetical protein